MFNSCGEACICNIVIIIFFLGFFCWAHTLIGMFLLFQFLQKSDNIPKFKKEFLQISLIKCERQLLNT